MTSNLYLYVIFAGIKGVTTVAVKTLKENATEIERNDLHSELQVGNSLSKIMVNVQWSNFITITISDVFLTALIKQTHSR